MRRTRYGYPQNGFDDRLDSLLIAVVVAVAAVAAWFTVSTALAVRVSSGRWPHLSLGAIVSAAVGSHAHISDPGASWPAAAIGHRPPPAWLVYGFGTLVAIGIAGAVMGSRALLSDRSQSARRTSGRGARWATPGDTGPLRVGRRRTAGMPTRRRGPARSNRLVLGRMQRFVPFRTLVATEARHSVLVLGPTQSGKTSGLAIPAILEWEGPVIATSVKDDLARVTLAARRRRGPVWIFDPTAGSGLDPPARWSPLSVCTDWTAAQKMASWLVDATPARSGMTDAAFWYAAAAKQLAPLLLAASRGSFTMGDVVRWTNTSDLSEPAQLLHLAGDIDAALALSACENRDERIRSSVSTTLETVLAPFEDPEVERWTSTTDVDIDEVVSGPATLFLCGPSHEQSRVQGLFAALVSAAVASVTDHAAAGGGPLKPPLLLVLDEAANIAPVRDLDTIASTGAGLGVQIVTICQDLSQLSARYGADRARTIVNNHRAKLLLSGVSDLSTLDLISGLAGEQAIREHTYTVDQRDGRRTRSSAVAFRRLAPADELRRVPPGEAVLVYGHLPPVKLKLRPWFADRGLRSLAGG